MVRAAILIDGGFFLKRLPSARRDIDPNDPIQVDRAIGHLVRNHLDMLNRQEAAANAFSLLYRCFFYDARPYAEKGHRPISGKAIDYAQTPEARFRLALFDALRRRANFAVRLGEVRRERSWILTEDAQKALLGRKRTVDDLTDDDFAPGFRQKAVDMRIGVDIASLALKKQADTVILVAGESDFVPAAKLARREGVRFVLDPLWRSVSPGLFEHIDGLRSGFARPRRAAPADDAANDVPASPLEPNGEADS